MEHVTEPTVRQAPGRLADLWRSRPTFSIVPVRQGVDLEWVRARADLLPASLRTDHFVLLTSGSTGRPKLIVGRRQRAEQLVHALHVAQRSHTVTHALVALPLSYCYAFVNQWLWSHLYHRELIITEGLADPSSFRRALDRATGTMLCLVGAQADIVVNLFKDHVFRGITRLHFAGGPFPQRHLPSLTTMFPNATIFNNFGCAEAMPRLTLRQAHPALPPNHAGRPLPGVRVRIGDGDQLQFNSPFQMVASIDDQGVHLVGSEDWLPTGDLASIDADGALLLHGRSGQVFKRYGEKISLVGLLQTVRESWPHQAAFYVERRDHAQAGHVLVLAPPPNKSQVRALLVALRKRYARPHWPVRVETIAQLPLLSNGKVDVRALPGHHESVQLWRQRIE